MNALKKNINHWCAIILLTLTPTALFAKTDNNPELWKEQIPVPIYPEKELIDLYWKTWEISHSNVKEGPPGLPCSPYMDEALWENTIWVWDTCFMSMFSKYSPKEFPGMGSLNNLYVPIIEKKETPLRIEWLDNPPLFSWIEHDYYRFSKDHERFNYIFKEKQYLQKHFDWFNQAKPGYTFNRSIGVVLNPIEDKGFTWNGVASGMDNTPRGRGVGQRKILWVDAISQQALSALSISRMYTLEGDQDKAQAWMKRYDRLKKTINDLYWNKEDGFYYDVVIETGEHNKVKTPAAFWPLLAEVATPEQAAAMTKHLIDDQVFGGERPWPSVARDDPDFNAIHGDYWRGSIWLPLVYMGTKALEKYGYYDLADDYAEKVIRHQLATYHQFTPNTIWECYNPSKNEPAKQRKGTELARHDFCGWSALGPISLFIENVLGFHHVDAIDNVVEWRLRPERGRYGIERLAFGPIKTDIIFDGKSTINTKSTAPYTLLIKNGKAETIQKITVPQGLGQHKLTFKK